MIDATDEMFGVFEYASDVPQGVSALLAIIERDYVVKPRTIRLTPNMIELLTDLVTNPEMYVRTFGKWGRTAEALRDRGLVTLHWCEGNQTRVVATQAGRDEAARRGLTNTGSSPVGP